MSIADTLTNMFCVQCALAKAIFYMDREYFVLFVRVVFNFMMLYWSCWLGVLHSNLKPMMARSCHLPILMVMHWTAEKWTVQMFFVSIGSRVLALIEWLSNRRLYYFAREPRSVANYSPTLRGTLRRPKSTLQGWLSMIPSKAASAFFELHKLPGHYNSIRTRTLELSWIYLFLHNALVSVSPSSVSVCKVSVE